MIWLQILLVYSASAFLLSLEGNDPYSNYTTGDPCIECNEDYSFYPNTFEK